MWNVSGAGYGNSPRLVDGKAYITSTDGNVYALDVSTGAKIWTHTIGSPIYGQPVVTGDHIYVTLRDDASAVHGIYCLDVSTGDEIWKVTIPEIAGYPTVEGDCLFVGALNVSSSNPIVFDGIVYALDASTGSEIWSHPTGTFSSENPNFVPVVAGQFIYFSVGNETYALDASTGTEKWNFTDRNAISSPLFSNSYVYVSSGANVYCLNASSGTEKWAFEIEGDEASSPVIADSQVYVGSVGSQYFAKSVYHDVYALDALNGDKLWNYTIQGNPYSMTVADDVVYVGASFVTSGNRDNEGDGAVYALKSNATASSSTAPIDLQIIVITAVIVAFLAVLLLVYSIRRKGTQSSTPATSLPET
jgi:outer membrane protein assembly factor BamB